MNVKRVMIAGVIAAGLSLGGQSQDVRADSGSEDPAREYRHAVMEAIAWNSDYFFDMLKGIVPYDAETAQMRADNIKALSTMPWEAFANRPEPAMMGDSLPSVWDNPAEFQAKAGEFISAASNLASVAASSEGAAKAAAAQLGGSCKECHDDFRAE